MPRNDYILIAQVFSISPNSTWLVKSRHIDVSSGRLQCTCRITVHRYPKWLHDSHWRRLGARFGGRGRCIGAKKIFFDVPPKCAI